MNRLFLKPSRPGLIVRDPRSKQPLPEAGAHKPDNSYWRRRLRSGDVVQPPVTLTVTGPTVSGGEVEIIVGNQRITVPVSPEDTADDIASRINAAVPTEIAVPPSAITDAERAYLDEQLAAYREEPTGIPWSEVRASMSALPARTEG